MRVSDKGADFIQRNEGFVAEPYVDVAGHATIGVGHLLHTGPVTEEERNLWALLTKDQAVEVLSDLFRRDLVRYEDAVTELVDHELRQTRFDALVDFTFNVGIGAFRDSTLLKVINKDAYPKRQDDIHEQLMRWVHAGGEVIPGMVKRREREWGLWATGAYE